MYEPYDGLDGRLFDLMPNPRDLFLSTEHREALKASAVRQLGPCRAHALCGGAGTGTTTLRRTALEPQPDGASSEYLSNPMLTRSEFLEFLTTSSFALASTALAGASTLCESSFF